MCLYQWIFLRPGELNEAIEWVTTAISVVTMGTASWVFVGPYNTMITAKVDESMSQRGAIFVVRGKHLFEGCVDSSISLISEST